MASSKVSTEQFVAIYMQQGGVVGNIAAQTGVGVASVKQRVKKLRSAGVRLPVQRKGKRYDVKALNEIIKQYKGNQ